MLYGGSVSVDPKWLLLIHQLPPKPSYFRVKIWRRLQDVGAVPIKNSVYVMPANEQSREDLQWVVREIEAGGGEGSVCEAHFVNGLQDAQVIELFNQARATDYVQLRSEFQAVRKTLKPERHFGSPNEVRTPLARLKRRFDAIRSIDFFECLAGRELATEISDFESSLTRKQSKPASMSGKEHREYRGRTWVTRSGIHIDRLASAWLIRRFIDADAKFKFVSAKAYKPLPGELRFDMFEADFTHEGNQCTFEVLLDRMQLRDDALRPIAEIVHDIDLKDSKFGRPEAAGIALLVAGIAMAHRDDEERLSRGIAVFDDLYAYFKQKMKPLVSEVTK